MRLFLALVFVLCVVPAYGQVVVGPNVTLSHDAVTDPNVTQHCYYKAPASGQYTIGQSMSCVPMNVVNGVNRQSISILNAQPGEEGYTVVTSADDAGNESDISNELHFQMEAAPLEVPSGYRFELVTPVN